MAELVLAWAICDIERKMTLRDKAYEFAKNAYGASGHAEAKDRLQKEFPHVDWDEVVSAYLDASRLTAGDSLAVSVRPGR
jgi:hypothetical protein